MANYVLLFGIILIGLVAFYIFKDFMAPACLVCVSFLLAYICACFSSLLGGWDFAIHYSTAFIIIGGLFSFFIGSLLVTGTKSKSKRKGKRIDYIVLSKTKWEIIIVVQILLLLLYIYYYMQTIAQFGGIGWFNMIRLYRFEGAYGEGLEVGIPVWVSQVTKLARANAYIATYILMHNLALRKVVKRRLPKVTPLIIIVVLYLPYNLLNAARFELMVVLSLSIIVWYTYTRELSLMAGKSKRNIKRTVWKIGMIVILAMAGFSAIAPLVGRTESNGMVSQAMDYFGRSIQAFDQFVQKPRTSNDLNEIESFYNVVKLISQLNLIDEPQNKFYLEFTSQNGISLGNTYTAFRRYYSDFGMVGVIVLSIIGGTILTYLYRKAKKPRINTIDFTLLSYAAIAYCMLLYCYEEYLFSTILSFNYLIIFAFLFLVYRWIIGDFKIRFRKRIKILRTSTAIRR